MDGHRRLLEASAVLFTGAVLLHNLDHLRRGPEATPEDVVWAGVLAVLVEIAVVALVFVRHPQAPAAAAAAGFGLAAGYLFVHFTPSRSWLSDSFLGGEVGALSVAAATVEVVAALALGTAGAYAVLRGRLAAKPRPRRMLHPVPAAMALGNTAILAWTFVAW